MLESALGTGFDALPGASKKSKDARRTGNFQGCWTNGVGVSPKAIQNTSVGVPDEQSESGNFVWDFSDVDWPPSWSP